MLPKKHVLYGIIFSLLAFDIFHQIGFLGMTIIFASSVLIDIDHYFASVLYGNGFGILKAFRWYMTKEENAKERFYKWIIPLHSIEFFIILIAAWYFSIGYISSIIGYIIIGCLLHIILDLYELFFSPYPLYLKLSFFYSFYRNWKIYKNQKI